MTTDIVIPIPNFQILFRFFQINEVWKYIIITGTNLDDLSFIEKEFNTFPQFDCSEEISKNLPNFTKQNTLDIILAKQKIPGFVTLNLGIGNIYSIDGFCSNLLKLLPNDIMICDISESTKELVYPDQLYVTKLKILKQ
jgi:hypothetical protein